MDFYSVFKLLHVLCAIAWVGGGLTLMAASILASRANNDAGLMSGLDVMNRLGKTWFVPASLLTVVFGAVTATFGGMWTEPWVILGLAGFASTFLTGLLLIEPEGRKIGGLIEAGDMAGAVVQGKRLLTIGQFDYCVMIAVIIDMVMKPGPTDFVVLAVMAAIVVAGGIFFLRPALERTPAASASA